MAECSKCNRPINANNKTGICTPCQKPGRYASGDVKPKRDIDDDAVLERVQVSSPKPPPPPKAKKPKPPPEPPGDIEEFFKLTEALGLDGQKMLDAWCRQWVARVRARALGGKPSEDSPVEQHDTATEAPADDPV